MASIFSKIIAGEIPCYKLAEDERFFSFLDIRPMAPGHALVIPKQEIDYFFDMQDQQLADIMIFAKRVAAAIKAEVPCKKVGTAVVGLEVPHAHIHLVPINEVSDMKFGHHHPMTHEELADLAARISNRL